MTEPTYALEDELGYLERSVSWTFSRAAADDREVTVDLSDVRKRIRDIKAELEKRAQGARKGK